jgi:SNF2 family DNA or RNA helicase
VHPKELNGIPFQMVIVDEAHRMRNPKSKQTRAAWHMLWSARYRVELTGTPASEDIGDLWALLHGLDRDAFPGQSKFMDLFANTSRSFYGGYEVLGIKPERRELFYKIVEPYYRRIPKERSLPQLPPRLPVSYRYPVMVPEQAKAYKQMADDMVAQLDQLLVASNVLVQSLRLMQLAAATADLSSEPCKCTQEDAQQPDPECPLCDGAGERQVVNLKDPSCKIDDLVEFIRDEGPRPLLVAAPSRKLIELAVARMAKEKISCASMTGATPVDERKNLVQAFQDGKIQVFFANAAGAEGLTFTRADTIFFLQRGSRLFNIQIRDRVHRIGSEGHEAIRTIVSLTKGTIEERREQMRDLSDKQIDEILRDKERLRWFLKGDA